MKIVSAHLENIRSHKDTTLNFERLTTISGLNHSGKSTIEQALELAFARRAEATGAGGQGQTDLLRFGEDLGAVELVLDIDGVPVEMRASLTKRSGLNVTLRNPHDKEWSPVALAQDLKADQDVLSCLLNNRFFVEMKPADQKSLLAAIILPPTYEWPESIKADLHNARITPPWTDTPFNIIEFSYDKAFKARTEVNRSIKDWRAPQDSGKYDGPPIDEVRATLATRQNERTAVAVKQNKMTNAIANAQDQKRRHEERAADAQTKIANERGGREAVAARALSGAAIKKLETEAAGAKQAADLESAILTRSTAITVYDKQIKAVATLEGIPKCPTCSQAITEDVIESLAAPLIAAKDALWKQNDVDQQTRKALGDPAGAQKKLDAALTVEQDLARIDKRIADLERQAKSALEEAAKIDPEALPKPDSLNEKVADLDARIQRGTGFLETASRADALKSDHAKAMKRKAELDEELARLERLVVYFGPKGIKADLISQHIGGFEQRINASLGKWGYQCALSIDPWSFVVKRSGSRYACQLHMLSRSEKLRFANAFSVALAVVSGWNFVVLDDSETIVGDEDSIALLKMLYESELDFALVLMATTVERTSSRPGTAFIALDESMEDEIGTTHVRELARTPR